MAATIRLTGWGGGHALITAVFGITQLVCVHRCLILDTFSGLTLYWRHFRSYWTSTRNTLALIEVTCWAPVSLQVIVYQLHVFSNIHNIHSIPISKLLLYIHVYIQKYYYIYTIYTLYIQSFYIVWITTKFNVAWTVRCTTLLSLSTFTCRWCAFAFATTSS